TTLLEADVAKSGVSVRTYYALGFCAEKRGDLKLAYDYYRSAVSLNLKNGKSEDSDSVKRSYDRLFEVMPAAKPVVERAWELEVLAGKAADKNSRDYLHEAAKTLHDYA